VRAVSHSPSISRPGAGRTPLAAAAAAESDGVQELRDLCTLLEARPSPEPARAVAAPQHVA
ncbi:MAG TPA: hypothetical protein VN231_13545, partial [Allosphingosinicella sp.]|nr:hypothetical protein [Allosphingosinicella sp.]